MVKFSGFMWNWVGKLPLPFGKALLSVDEGLSRSRFFVLEKPISYKQIKIQKIASNSDCFLMTPCLACEAYFAQDERIYFYMTLIEEFGFMCTHYISHRAK